MKSSVTPGVDGTLPLGDPAIYYSDDVGFFYLIQLEPGHDPGRFKVGFTMDLEGRLRKHRYAAPFAQYLCSFPSKRVWERAAIDCVTNGCERLHTEVFRAERLAEIASRAQAFFSMMPILEVELEDDRDDREPQ